jgi:hypothetical protein
MRLPIGALIAALVVVAAGSVVVTTYFKQAQYTVNATGLAVGGNVTVQLSFIPREIFVLAENATYKYDVYVYANATFRAPGGALYEGGIVYTGVPANGTVTVHVVSARSASCKVTVVRTA